ncbi:site-specific DNA-methyltransferase [Polynucleobacter sp.]|uniref:site-specific DNA-methyltransferase n=1 Tax=Polynucleobacter sp. TaxID=2029855 RepID=UPI0025857439|nr:site-specific DNA-methyltransferase [Polynucleobacter sp.]MCX7237135.1 site-specific DNA-methyltransferase [Polynucleobacter sp.]
MSKPNVVKIQIELVNIDSIHANPTNPRIHTLAQIQQIAKSIERFGWNIAIAVGKDGMILAGNGRYEAAKLLGLKEIPIVRLSHLTKVQAKAYIVADNKLTENSQWDERLLGQIFLELSKADLDFELTDTGFEVPEIDLLIESIENLDDQVDPLDIPNSSLTGPPVCRPNDLWNLDAHRVLCGNALDPDAYKLLMNGSTGQIVFLDPPFNCPISGHVTSNTGTKHREFKMGVGEMSSESFTQFLSKLFELLVQFSDPGSIHCVAMDWRGGLEIINAGNANYSELKNICVWIKDKAGLGSLYRSQHEFFYIFKNGKAPHRNNIQLGKHGRYRTNYWSYPSASTMTRKGTDGNLLAFHPTSKPIALVADFLLDCSARNEIVIDCCLGGGTTLLAAQRTGRICYAMELDPLYVDTSIRRWQAMTGQDAILASTGQTFNELEKLLPPLEGSYTAISISK